MRILITAILLSLPALSQQVTLSGVAGAVLVTPGSQIPVGTRISWAASSGFSGAVVYQWSVKVNGGAGAIVGNFDVPATFRYMPLNDGSITVSVIARDSLGTQATASTTFTASPLASGSNPVVTVPRDPASGSALNPLIALYSAVCSSGNMRVYFAPQGTPVTQGSATPFKPCVAGHSLNFIIAGMRASSTYTIQHQITSGFSSQYGPPETFTTGPVTGVPVPLILLRGASSAPEKVILEAFIQTNANFTSIPEAFDLQGNLIWYDLANQGILRAVAGGTFFSGYSDQGSDGLQETDLLGNVIHRTSIGLVTQQLAAIGQPRVYDFDHDAIRLPNGYTAVICFLQKVYTDGTQGSSPANPVDVAGQGIAVLDANWQVVWFWNPYDRLNVAESAIFNEVCLAGGGNGCTDVVLPGFASANDWMHANALWFTDDQNLLLSIRHLDKIVKIDYRNGAGTGAVLWTLGQNGDFTITNPGVDIVPWFSHQHDMTYRGNYMTVFDNGNTRVDNLAGSGARFACFVASVCYSRGQAWNIDEVNHTATLVTNANIGSGTAVANGLGYEYSSALGDSQRLSNGNLHFLSGFAYQASWAESEEFTPAGLPVYTFAAQNAAYRSMRMKDLYSFQP